MLQAANLLLLRHGSDLALLGSKNLSQIAPDIKHQVAVVWLGFFGIIHCAEFGKLCGTGVHHPGHTGVTLGCLLLIRVKLSWWLLEVSLSK